MVRWRRDGLSLGISTSRRPLRSCPPLGRGSLLPGRVGKGVIPGNLKEKMRHGRTFVFGVAPRFDAADAADGWLDGRLFAPQAERIARGGGWLADRLDYAFEVLDCHASRLRGLSCEAQTSSGPREPALPKGS